MKFITKLLSLAHLNLIKNQYSPIKFSKKKNVRLITNVQNYVPREEPAVNVNEKIQVRSFQHTNQMMRLL